MPVRHFDNPEQVSVIDIVKPTLNHFGNRNSSELRVYNHSVGIVLAMRTILASIIPDRKDGRIELNEDVVLPKRVGIHVNDGVALREPRDLLLDFFLLDIVVLSVERVIGTLIPVAMEPFSAKAYVEQGLAGIEHVEPLVTPSTYSARKLLLADDSFLSGVTFVHDEWVVEHAQRPVIVVFEF